MLNGTQPATWASQGGSYRNLTAQQQRLALQGDPNVQTGEGLAGAMSGSYSPQVPRAAATPVASSRPGAPNMFAPQVGRTNTPAGPQVKPRDVSATNMGSTMPAPQWAGYTQTVADSGVPAANAQYGGLASREQFESYNPTEGGQMYDEALAKRNGEMLVDGQYVPEVPINQAPAPAPVPAPVPTTPVGTGDMPFPAEPTSVPDTPMPVPSTPTSVPDTPGTPVSVPPMPTSVPDTPVSTAPPVSPSGPPVGIPGPTASTPVSPTPGTNPPGGVIIRDYEPTGATPPPPAPTTPTTPAAPTSYPAPPTPGPAFTPTSPGPVSSTQVADLLMPPDPMGSSMRGQHPGAASPGRVPTRGSTPNWLTNQQSAFPPLGQTPMMGASPSPFRGGA